MSLSAVGRESNVNLYFPQAQVFKKNIKYAFNFVYWLYSNISSNFSNSDVRNSPYGLTWK